MELETNEAEVSNNATGNSATLPSAAELLNDLGVKPEESGLDEPAEEPEAGLKTKTAEEILEDEEALNDDEKKVDANSKESNEKSDDLFEIKHGDSIKKLSRDEVKELAQKGFDYTQKTQAIAQERKEFEALRQKYDADLEKAVADVEEKHKTIGEKSKVLDVWDHALEDIEAKNPDLYQEIAKHFAESKRALENPVTRRLQSELEQTRALVQQLQENLNGGRNAAKEEYIRKTFSDEMTKVQDKYSTKFTTLGLKPDWEKVKQSWIAGNDAGLTVHQALMAVHGEDIVKLFESRGKVADAKLKSDLAAKKPPTSGGLNKLSGKQTKASPNLMKMKDADFWANVQGELKHK
jgi:hypothetical protein